MTNRFRSKLAQPAADKSLHPREFAGIETIALAILVVAELWLFSGAFRKFFTHDSLFYMIHVPRSWGQFLSFLLGPSDESSYRPLNLGFIALVRPFLGVDPHPYHWIPIVFHVVNTLLFYFLAKRILASSAAAFAAAGFWGLHAVAGWITYDITYLSDFLLGFLLLSSLLLGVEGSLRRSRTLQAASIVFFVLTLLTKEAATTFPLALWICLGLAELRASGDPASARRIVQAFRKTFPLTAVALIISFAFAILFVHWFRAGLIYSQGTQAAYNIDPWSNPLAKAKYLYWALNLPDALSIANPARNRALALAAMGFVLLIWGFDILRRRIKLSVIEWMGIIWFAGLNVPSLLLSSRLAKWYLYLPLLGLALAFGAFVDSMRTLVPAKLRTIAGPVFAGLLLVPVLISSSVQTRSYIVSSDSAFQSDVLQGCLRDFRAQHPTLPPNATLFFLPAFDEHISGLLSSPPIDRGELFELYYPGTRVQAKFGHKGERLPDNLGNRSDVFVLQYLDGHLYDVTGFFRTGGKMTLFLLPTAEGKAAPLLEKEPAGGRKTFAEYVQMSIADEGARLPEDYRAREDIWILQYMNGRFTDVTGYYRGRHAENAARVIKGLEGLQYSVSRDEYYPDYEHFGTPTGAPVFFPTPEKDILTQVGGSTVVSPLHRLAPNSSLVFDVSWMFDQGDGGWAEALLRSQGREYVLYREHMTVDPARRSLLWREVRVDLQRFANEEAELILKCYNDKGRNTVADWLNWRDIAIESK